MRLTSHIHPGCNSPRSRSWYLRLNPIQLTSHLYADPENCISYPSRSNLKPIQVPLCVSYFDSDLPHLHPWPKNLVSPPSMCCLTSIQVQKFFFHRHPYRVSRPFRSHLNSMQGTVWFSPPPTSRPIPTHAPRFTCHLHPDRAATQSRIPHFCLISVQVMSNLNVGPGKCITAPSRSHISRPSTSENVRLTSIQVIPCLTFPWLLSHPKIHVASHLQTGQDVGISHPSISCLTSIQVKRFASQLHPSSTSTYPSFKMCVLTQSKSYLTPKSQYLHSISIQAPRLTPSLHPDHISPQSISL